MSVLIKDMEMPTTCERCPLNYEAECNIAPNYDRKDWESFLVAENGRRDDCPLIEVKLVDQEEVIMPLNMIGGYLEKVEGSDT